MDDWVKVLYDNLTPREFEKLLYVLLEKMGFENIQLTGKSGDGGVDLRASYTPEIPGLQVGLDFVIQAKRFAPETTINPIFLRALVGKIRGGEWGLLITTGRVTQKTREEGLEDRDRVVAVIDGKTLVDLCQKHGVAFKFEYSFDRSFLAPRSEPDAVPEPEIVVNAPDSLAELLSKALQSKYERVGRTLIYKNQSDGSLVLGRWSQRYQRKAYHYWFGLRVKDLATIQENGVSGFAYVLGREGVVLIPVQSMVDEIQRGSLGRSNPKAGYPGHYHILFGEENGQHTWVMREGRKENVQEMFHKI